MLFVALLKQHLSGLHLPRLAERRQPGDLGLTQRWKSVILRHFYSKTSSSM
jgi:hypothetical protein